MIILEHVLLVLKAGISASIPAAPRWVMFAAALGRCQHHEEKRGQQQQDNNPPTTSIASHSPAVEPPQGQVDHTSTGPVVFTPQRQRQRQMPRSAPSRCSEDTNRRIGSHKQSVEHNERSNTSHSLPHGELDSSAPALISTNSYMRLQPSVTPPRPALGAGVLCTPSSPQTAPKESLPAVPSPPGIATGHPRSAVRPLLPHPGPDTGDSRHQATVDTFCRQFNSRYGFDPLTVTLLLVLPPVLYHTGCSPWLYLPIGVLFLSYLQATKDRIDHQAAIGIVSDPALIRLIVQELPSWISDSHFQRVEWFNTLVQKLWPKISLAAEASAIQQLQPILDASCPQMLSFLKLKRFSLGSISPKIIGVKIDDGSESVIRLDVEFRWAGDPVISISAGTRPVPTPIKVSELRFSATARVELLDITTQLPCFKALSVTFMKKPFLDFSIKLARLDIMNLGPKEFNLTKVVRNILHAALTEVVLYPKKIIIPVQADVDTSEFAVLKPVGILHLLIERGVDLKRANIFGSDPYVCIKTTEQTARTAIKSYDCNPVWDECHDLVVYDKASQVVHFSVYDADMVHLETFLGRASIRLEQVAPYEEVRTSLELRDVSHGAMVVSYQYIPIASAVTAAAAAAAAGDCTGEDAAEQEELEGILYDMEEAELNNDVLLSDDDFNGCDECDECDPAAPFGQQNEDCGAADNDDEDESVWVWRNCEGVEGVDGVDGVEGGDSDVLGSNTDEAHDCTQNQDNMFRASPYTPRTPSTSASHKRTPAPCSSTHYATTRDNHTSHNGDTLRSLHSRSNSRHDHHQDHDHQHISTSTSNTSFRHHFSQSYLHSHSQSNHNIMHGGMHSSKSGVDIGALTVTSITLRHMPVVGALLAGAPQYYITFELNGSRRGSKRTKPLPQLDAAPLSFTDSFSFIAGTSSTRSTDQEKLVVRVMRVGRAIVPLVELGPRIPDVLMGKVTVRLSEVKGSAGAVLESDFMLVGTTRESYVGLKLTWAAAAVC